MKFLVEKGANVNARDDIWYQTPLSSAVGAAQLDTVRFLIKSGAKDVDAAALSAAGMGNVTLLQAILEMSKVSQDTLDAALNLASSGTNQKLKDALEKAGAKPLPPASENDRKNWAKFAGSYDSDGGAKLAVAVKETGLVINGRVVSPAGPDTFVPIGTVGTELPFRAEKRRSVPHHA